MGVHCAELLGNFLPVVSCLVWGGFVARFSSVCRDMAQEAWRRCMDDVGLPAAAAKLVIAKGYVSKASFTKAFCNEEALEKFIEAVLTWNQQCGIVALRSTLWLGCFEGASKMICK